MYINTGQEFDGSDSGARPDEAVSWGKIRAGAETVKVRCHHSLSGVAEYPTRSLRMPRLYFLYSWRLPLLMGTHKWIKTSSYRETRATKN